MQKEIYSTLNPLFKISAVIIVASLPRTASNKVMRKNLRAMYKAGQALRAQEDASGAPPQAYICGYARTEFGQYRGSLKGYSATQLGAIAIHGALARAQISPHRVDEVFMGNVYQAGLGQNPARQASMLAGLPSYVDAVTVNKVCASGMVAIHQAAQNIWLGNGEVYVAGGMESMTNTLFYSTAANSTDLPINGLQKDGLTDAFHNISMGVFAEKCARDHDITREQQDDFAIRTFEFAKADIEDCARREIVPLGNNVPSAMRDEAIAKADYEKMRRLRPAFLRDDPDATVTAGNASPISDGAAAVVVVRASTAVQMGLTPLAVIVAAADGATSPEDFTIAPSVALPLALQRAKLPLSKIDAFEFNEAFAVVPMANAKRLGLTVEKVNLLGGAVARGHPLGASGARIVMSLIRALEKTNGEYGAAAVCNGGGSASAMILRRIIPAN